MATARDPGDVSRHGEVILRRLVAARAAGDAGALREAWKALLTVTFDRIRAIVIAESHDRLSRQEQEDALQLACERLTKLVQRPKGFRGSSMGEYVNLVKRVVKAACIDTQRGEARHSRHRAQLHATDDEGEERYTREAYEAITREHEEREQALAAAEELRTFGEEFLAWALPRLTKAQRALIECDREGLPCEEIMRRLGKKRDAVYKTRERAIEALRKLYEEWER